jgi:hypothetical protein
VSTSASHRLAVLRLLSEAGLETLPTIVNQIARDAPTQAVSDLQFLLDVLATISAMQQEDMISLHFYSYAASESTQAVVAAHASTDVVAVGQRCIVWSEDAEHWTWRIEECGESRLAVMLEQPGRQYLESIMLDENDPDQ